jgi:hypothetical protein
LIHIKGHPKKIWPFTYWISRNALSNLSDFSSIEWSLALRDIEELQLSFNTLGVGSLMSQAPSNPG